MVFMTPMGKIQSKNINSCRKQLFNHRGDELAGPKVATILAERWRRMIDSPYKIQGIIVSFHGHVKSPIAEMKNLD